MGKTRIPILGILQAARRAVGRTKGSARFPVWVCGEQAVDEADLVADEEAESQA